MSGIIELKELLKNLSPAEQPGEFVFCSVKGDLSDFCHLKPIASFIESEGLTLVLPVESADKAGIEYRSKFKQITLTVHSSLDAVGLTAAVANKLTQHGVSANVIAAYYHDHIFVQTDRVEDALTALKLLSETS